MDPLIRERESEREKEAMAAAIDDSCRRPGSVPFKWEVCPGTPKHVRSSSASAAPPPYSSPSPLPKVAVSPKLTPPPAMSLSPYHSPRVSYYAARSASVSPSRRRAPHRPTAFLDIAPRVAPASYGPGPEDEDTAASAAASRCFPLPVFRRRDRDGKRGSGSGRQPGASSSGSSFRSDGAPWPTGLRRSASSSSSSCLSLSSRSSGKLVEAREVEAAGGWFY
ncbi:hypothetical protein GQ55_8G049900 [Panicum hallii var. hallii]|uniref:Uncharacterized protein n=1 Tax=Panicum hallii var. hallii TaxID=1504633 RepID=A0A2T7CKW8_9POAL|nr:hypothetical protein GQ55_8G049900 [Panicum hallii var. hallii]